jgi:diguanylate cyclase (GGDEF)-like protein
VLAELRGAEQPGRPHLDGSPFRHVPAPVRVVVVGVGVASAAGTVLAAAGAGPVQPAQLGTAGALLAASFADVEFGRLAEGGRTARNRPHKGLSAWPFAAAMLLPAVYAALLVPPVYAWARLRGMRIPLWKWGLSGGAVTLAALAADVTHTRLGGSAAPLVGSGRGLAVVAAAAAVFLAVESAVVGAVVTLNVGPEDEPMRRLMRRPAFYLTESAVLATGTVTAVLLRFSPWFLLAALPVYALSQRAVLHAPLQEEARTDAKTGVSAYRHWRMLAERELARTHHGGSPVAVLLADLDHFKQVNDRYGHLAGDRALRAAADALCGELRDRDLVGRFGGEEFCLVLPRVDEVTAPAVAERLRGRVGAVRVVPDRLSVSIGGCVVPTGTDLGLHEVLALADRALYDAKAAGRNQVRIETVLAGPNR